MGWTVLYIAFGVVALWLLGEVLLQYKARLRWRLVAFCGFLGVVVGVLLPSVPVIAAGTVAFAIGQTFVTLSFRRGFSTGWALGGKPGTSRRRREAQQGEMRPLEPLAEDAHADAAGYDAYASADGQPGGQQYEGHEGPYEGYAAQYDGGQEQPGQPDPSGQQGSGYTQEIFPEPPQYPATAGFAEPYQEPYGDPLTDPLGAGDTAAYPEQPAADPYQQPVYASYTDPYAGGPGTGGEQYADYGTHPFQPDFPADGQPGSQPEQPPYAASYASDYASGAGFVPEQGMGDPWPASDPYYSQTPPDGVWVPQQREPDPATEGGGYGHQQPEPYPQPEGYYFDQGQRY